MTNPLLSADQSYSDYVQSEGLALRIHGWNPDAEQTLVLVHGYPDSSEVWRPLVEHLASDYHVVIYDVRGCGESEAPHRISDYQLIHLKRDLQAVIRVVSPRQKIHLIGHDWGSIQCWDYVADPAFNNTIASYTSISGPNLDQVGHWFRKRLQNPLENDNWRDLANQLSHSWYIGMFHLPGLAPSMWKLGLDKAWPKIVGWMENTEVVADPLQRRNGVNGINLYRANMLPRLLFPDTKPTTVPVQLVVAEKDAFVTPALLTDIEQWAPNLTRVTIPASHWLPLAQPEWLAEKILGFVAPIEP